MGFCVPLRSQQHLLFHATLKHSNTTWLWVLFSWWLLCHTRAESVQTTLIEVRWCSKWFLTQIFVHFWMHCFIDTRAIVFPCPPLKSTSGQTLQAFHWDLDKTLTFLLQPLNTSAFSHLESFYLKWADRARVFQSYTKIQSRIHTVLISAHWSCPTTTHKNQNFTQTHSPESALVPCVIYVCAESWGVC